MEPVCFRSRCSNSVIWTLNRAPFHSSTLPCKSGARKKCGLQLVIIVVAVDFVVSSIMQCGAPFGKRPFVQLCNGASLRVVDSVACNAHIALILCPGLRIDGV